MKDKLELLSWLQISSGEEGWRVDGGINSSWITNGTKGVDFAGNLELFDFATVHLCKPPSSTHVNDATPCETRTKHCKNNFCAHEI